MSSGTSRIPTQQAEAFPGPPPTGQWSARGPSGPLPPTDRMTFGASVFRAASLVALLAMSLALSLVGLTASTNHAQDGGARQLPGMRRSSLFGAQGTTGTKSTTGATGTTGAGRIAGGIRAANANIDEEREATFFMGRIRYSNNDGNDCSRVGENLVKLVAQVSTIQVQRERVVAFNDPQLFATPFLFINGHNDFKLSDAERLNLRNYFQKGGFLLASGCCTNPGFPQACRRELSQILPGERIRRLSYDHPIYRSFYKLSRIRCLHEPRDIYLEGLFDRGRLVAVMCEDGLCCAFSMDNRCNVDKGVSPDDGRKLALNIAVYSLTH